MEDDVPLPGAGILRLVDQHVIDAAIELVVHPAGGDARQHRQRLVDQIVIVEQAAFRLLAPVVCRRRGRDVEQRPRAIAGHDRAALFDQRVETPRFGIEQRADRRIAVAKFPGQDGFARRLLVCQENAQVYVQLLASGQPRCLAESSGLIFLGPAAAAVECGCDLEPARARQVRSIDDLAFDGLDPVVIGNAERRRHLRRRNVGIAGDVGPGHEVVAAEAGLAHHVLEGDVGGARHRDLERLSGRAPGIARRFEQHLEIGALHHLGLVTVVENRKTRRHVGLERKLLQQPRAERVNGLHLQAARRFQRACKQFARGLAQACGRMRDADVPDRGIEACIVQRDPVAERREHPLRHVGGGGLGEGDAEDFLRRHAGKQQADHALHQHMGLAGAGIGRHEGRSCGVRRALLRVAHRAGNWTRRLHHSSSPRPPAADHSLMRARSS